MRPYKPHLLNTTPISKWSIQWRVRPSTAIDIFRLELVAAFVKG